MEQLNMKEVIPKYLLDTIKKYPDKPAYQYRGAQKQWQVCSWSQLHERILNLACALADLGVEPKSSVAIIADNRFEWIQTDFAIQFNNAISVPRGSDSTGDEMKYIIEHSDSSVVVVENSKVYDKIKPHLTGLSKVKTIIAMDSKGINDDSVLDWQQVYEKGKTLREKHDAEVAKRLQSIDPEDVFTIIYTSGTTGAPKGVQLVHKNEVHQMRVVPKLGMNPCETFLSILPVWHVFERMAEYVAIATGSCIVYTNIRDLKNDIKEVKPTFMASAPRLWEQIYLGIYNNVKAGSPIKRGMFNIAYALSRFNGKATRFLKGHELKLTQPNPLVSLAKTVFYLVALPVNIPFYLLFDTIVLKKVRQATGGRLRATVSGGGALPRHVDEFFNNIGITVLEGYGMTESAPVIAARSFQKPIIGSVGPVAEEVLVEIRDIESNKPLPQGQKGVVWTKGPHVMKGYYKMPEKTAETIVDGWLNTGDMGMINFNDTLTLTGRAKDTIVLVNGENIEPVPIENKLLESEYFAQLMVVGQDKKNLGVLIYPEISKIAKFLGPDTDPDSLTVEDIKNNKECMSLIASEIKRLISASTGFKAFEKVQVFRLIPKAFEVDDEITNLGKIKRHVVTKKYEDLIEDMYKDDK